MSAVLSRRPALVIAGALLVLVALFLVQSAASGQPTRPPRPGTPVSTFRPPGFDHAAPAANPSGGAPGPFVQGFGPHGGATKPAGAPGTKPSLPANLDGCDHTYGNVGQCVPATFPAGVTDRCAWLRAHNFGPLRVHGPDRLRLDSNHDRIACGPGDR
jgi:hypothetical protein